MEVVGLRVRFPTLVSVRIFFRVKIYYYYEEARKEIIMDNRTLMIVGTTAVGLGVCGAVGYACHVTKSAFPLLGLMFIPTVSLKTVNQ